MLNKNNKKGLRMFSVFSLRKRISVLALFGLMVALWFGSIASAQEAQNLNWVTTWSMSPSTLPPSLLPEDAITDAFDNQTLRLIAHVSAGGEMVRIRLSNTHGDKRLNIGAATIALQTSDAQIDPSTLTPLTFGGSKTITIARGGLVFSDPVPFDLPDLSNVSVSLFLPEASGLATSHLASMQISYLADGDFSDALTLPEAQELTAWSYLSAIDVGRDDEISAIVTLGDSITDGVGSSTSSNNRWPNYLARRLQQSKGSLDFAVVNAGLSGNRVLHESSPRFGENLQVRFERDVLALSGVSHIVLLEGINDLGMSELGLPEQEVSADEVIAGYRQIIARAHAKGIKVIGATLTPFEGAVYYTEEGEQKRQRINAWLRGENEFDGIIDFDIPVQDKEHSARLIPEFTADNLHPNDAGYAAMAAVIDLDLFR